MEICETSATVEDWGQVHVAGVPFAPGTEVEVPISPKGQPGRRPTATGDAVGNGGAGLGWDGNVLVYRGVGAGPSVAELRDERLSHPAEGQPG